MGKTMKYDDIPPIQERFDHLLNLISSERFLKKAWETRYLFLSVPIHRNRPLRWIE